jgi:Tfp pilus assembly protein PilX
MRPRTGRNITILNIRGTAIIMALVTMTILLLLGLAVATLSMGTLKANTADATTNDAYYAAEAGVNNALDQLKLEVARYYKGMTDAQGTVYTGLYNNFASGIAAHAQTNFSEPAFSGGSTSTTFSVSGYDAQTNVYEFLGTTTSTMADGTKYVVEGRLNVKRVDVSAKSWYSDLGALVVGGTMTVNKSSGMTVKGGNAVLGNLVNNQHFVVNAPGITIIDPIVKQSINDVLDYPSFSDPVISNPTHYYAADSTIYRVTSGSNIYILNPGFSIDTPKDKAVNLTFLYNDTIPKGIIRASGDLAMNTGVSLYCDMYCRNFSNSSSNIYGDIYARGNVTKTGGNVYGNIYCDGNVTLSNIGVYGSIICGGNITINGATTCGGNMFAGGTIDLSGLNATGDVIYAKEKIISRAHISAIVFSGGNIEVFAGGWIFTGAVITKNNFSNTGWWNINYSANDIAAKLANIKGTFFDTGGGGTALDGTVFQGQSITAKGRVN